MSDNIPVNVTLREAAYLLGTRTSSVVRLLGNAPKEDTQEDLRAAVEALELLKAIDDMCYVARRIAEDDIQGLQRRIAEEETEETTT